MDFFQADSRVLHGRLDNGLTYYIRHNETPRGMACFYLVKRIGSVMEEDGEQGYAHFLEHMGFEGMEGFPGNGIIRSMEAIGVRFGEELNAYTNAEETVYTMKNVPVSSENTDLCLRAIRGWICGLNLMPDAVESEKGIILDEFRVTSNPIQRMFDRMQKGIYQQSRYGDRPVLGTEQSVSLLDIESLRNFYRKWSRQDLSAIIAVGDFDPVDMERRIRSLVFPDLVNKPPRPTFSVPDNDEPVILEQHDPEQKFPRTAIWIKRDVQPADYINSHEALLEDYVSELVVRMLNSRLQYIANGNDAVFLEAQVSLSDFLLSSTKRMMEVIIDMQPEKFSKGLYSCLVQLRRAASFGFTPSELERAKRGWMNSMETNYNEREKRTSDSFCSEYLRNFTRLEPIPSIEDEYDFARDVIPAVTISDVNSAVEKLLTGKNMVIGCFLPDDCLSDISEIVTSASNAQTTPYNDPCLYKALIDPLPQLGTIEVEEGSLYGYRHFILGNGANVYLKTTDYADDDILFKCFRSKGRKNYRHPIESFAVEYIAEIGGLGDFSRQDLYSMTEDKQIEIRPQNGVLIYSMECSSNRKDAETLLQILYLYFTSRRKDEAAFAVWKERMRNVLKTNQTNPVEQVYRLLDVMLFEDSDNYTKILPEQIDGINYDTVCAIADDMFSDASSFSFIFTGNITADELRPLIRQYISTLPSSKTSEKQELYHILKPGVETSTFHKPLETPAAYSASVLAGYVDPGIRSDVLTEMLGHLFEMELLEKVREKEGEVYSIYSYGYTTNCISTVAFLYTFFQSECGREENILETVGSILNDGPSEDKLERCKEYMMKKYRNDLRTNKFFQKKLASYLISGHDTLTDYENVLQNIVMDDVRHFLSLLTARKRILLLPPE